MSASASAAQLGCDKKNIRHWVARYEQYGEEGLRMKHGSYSRDFKLSVITYMRENHLSLFETAVKFGIPRNWTVNQWDSVYTREGTSGLYRDYCGKMKKSKNSKSLAVSKASKSKEDELLAELEYLRAENAYLKKLEALVEERVA